MNRCVVLFKDSSNFVNIKATEIVDEQGFLKILNGDDMVGFFSIDSIKAAYITEKGD